MSTLTNKIEQTISFLSQKKDFGKTLDLLVLPTSRVSGIYSMDSISDLEEIQARLNIIKAITEHLSNDVNDKLDYFHHEQARIETELAGTIEQLCGLMGDIKTIGYSITGIVNPETSGKLMELLPTIGYSVGKGEHVITQKGVPGLVPEISVFRARLDKVPADA
jgi:hypothetical protein